MTQAFHLVFAFFVKILKVRNLPWLYSRLCKPNIKAVGCLESNRLAKSPFFSLSYYRSLYTDLALFDDTSLVKHYLNHGRWENRKPAPRGWQFQILGISNEWSTMYAKTTQESSDRIQTNSSLTSRDYVLYIHSKVNWHIRIHAEVMASLLSEEGCSVSIVDETFPEPHWDTLCIVIAPHEFWPRGVPMELQDPRFISRAILYQTEQIGSPWFDLALPYVYTAKGVIDVSPQTALLFKQFIPSTHLILPFDAAVQERLKIDLPSLETDFELRALDCCLFAQANIFRDSVMQELAEVLPDLACHIEYASDSSPSKDFAAETRRQVSIASQSRIHICINRHPSGFFTWDRMVMNGLAVGALPLSTPVLPVPGLNQGQHFLAVSAKQLPATLRYLTRDKRGIDLAKSVAMRGKSVVRSKELRQAAVWNIKEFLDGLDGTGAKGKGL